MLAGLGDSYPLAVLQRSVIRGVYPAPVCRECGQAADNVLALGLKLYIDGNTYAVVVPEVKVGVLIEQPETQGKEILAVAVAEFGGKSTLRAVYILIVCIDLIAELFIVHRIGVILCRSAD